MEMSGSWLTGQGANQIRQLQGGRVAHRSHNTETDDDDDSSVIRRPTSAGVWSLPAGGLSNLLCEASTNRAQSVCLVSGACKIARTAQESGLPASFDLPGSGGTPLDRKNGVARARMAVEGSLVHPIQLESTSQRNPWEGPTIPSHVWFSSIYIWLSFSFLSYPPPLFPCLHWIASTSPRNSATRDSRPACALSTANCQLPTGACRLARPRVKRARAAIWKH